MNEKIVEIINNAFANGFGQLLKPHTLAVMILAVKIAEKIGLSTVMINGMLIDVIRQVKIAALGHDIGKIVSYIRKYLDQKAKENTSIIGKFNDDEEDTDEKYLDMPLHHEISWALLANKINRIENRLALNAIYWSHAQPVNESYDILESQEEILKNISKEDISLITCLWNDLVSSCDLQLDSSTDMHIDELKIPQLFEKDLTMDKDINSIQMAVRGCVITADRFISSLDHVSVQHIANKTNDGDNIILEMIAKMFSGHLGSHPYKLPSKFDPLRFNIQEEIAILATKHRTVIAKVTAGGGKTVIGLMWSHYLGGKTIWVTPRNDIAETSYLNILKDMHEMGMHYKVELILGGKRKKCNFTEDVPLFCADIVVTNIDNILSPMTSNKSAKYFASILSSNMVFDEYQEFRTGNPLFAAFVILMRMRNRILGNCKSLLLSATDGRINFLWDNAQNKTVILPSENNHYPAIHKEKYMVSLTSKIPIDISPGGVFITNSISNAQGIKRNGSYNVLCHSNYTDKHRDINTSYLTEYFGKSSKGVTSGHKVVSAPIIQAAYDISFTSLTVMASFIDLELQRIGRIGRWGFIFNGVRTECFIKLVMPPDNINDLGEEEKSFWKSNMAAIRTMGSENLHRLWVGFFKSKFATPQQVTLDELYDMYNEFYAKYEKETSAFLRLSYDEAMNGVGGLHTYMPQKGKGSNCKGNKSSNKSLRSPDGSYFFTVKKSNDEWLSPEEVMSEDIALKRKYDKNPDLIRSLVSSSKMKFILKKLGAIGYNRYEKMISRKNWRPPTPEKWFRMARNPETPLPDVSRTYHQNGEGNDLKDVGLGLIKE